MPELKNLEHVNPHACKAVQDYVTRLLDLHGENVLSVMVYGSAVRQDFSPKRSDINLAVVVRELKLDTLKTSLKLVARGIRRRIAAPLFLTWEYISSSVDVFPIEFLDMRDSHVTIFGEDVLIGIDVKSSDLRLECEEQIKGKLLRLRQAYLELGHSSRGISLLLHKSLSSLIPVLRALLTLKGKTPPAEKEDVLTLAAKVLGIDPSPFQAVLRDKMGGEKIAGEEASLVLEKFLDQIARLAQMVDAL